MRTGQHYLDSLKDGRTVYVDGQKIPDVTAHPATRGISRTIASLYDFAADPANGMIYTAPETGGPANRCFMTPRSRDDLRLRREAITRWARLTNGLVGRGPDHVAGFLAGFASAPDLFSRGPRPLGEHVQRFYRKVLADNLYVTYVLVPPQIDRSKTAHEQDDRFAQV